MEHHISLLSMERPYNRLLFLSRFRPSPTAHLLVPRALLLGLPLDRLHLLRHGLDLRVSQARQVGQLRLVDLLRSAGTRRSP